MHVCVPWNVQLFIETKTSMTMVHKISVFMFLEKLLYIRCNSVSVGIHDTSFATYYMKFIIHG